MIEWFKRFISTENTTTKKIGKCVTYLFFISLLIVCAVLILFMLINITLIDFLYFILICIGLFLFICALEYMKV
jgi:hypothetical protein